MSAVANELADLFARDLERVAQELRAFPDTASMWKTVPGVANAAGTLALHLEGGLRHFIGLRLGRIDYTRDRPLEFSARGVERDELIARIEAVRASIPAVIAALTDARDRSGQRQRPSDDRAPVAHSLVRPLELPPRAD